MNDFNIEHLERKTPYPVPGDFFETMQQEVLRQIPKATEAPVRRLHFRWMAAAAAALVAGLSFLFLRTNAPQNPPMESQTTVVAQTSVPASHESPAPEFIAKKQTEPSENQKENTNKIAVSHQVTAQDPQAETAPDEIESTLASFTPEEIRQSAKNTEQDVYLDLYR